MSATKQALEEKPEETRMLLYDTELRRPACVLLQVVAGGDRDLLLSLFDSSTWLVAPTPGMKRIHGTMAQWRKAAGAEDDRQDAERSRP